MISARLRFVVLVAAAVAAAAMAGLYARAGLLIPGALPCLIGAGFLAEAAVYVRRTAHRLQERHHQALLLAELGAVEPWGGWCCERGWLTHGDLHHPNYCTRST
ncbi:hypothetical protein ABZS83_32945 [Streptomyces sp. NPDC005426]|uniref:hypothetical protein n=1 Tax=Streptomyces sp. NPDC005426 TaxID=3155344 RepID=UPI0033B3CD30